MTAEMPSGVDEDECGIATKKPCAELATADVHAMLHLLGDMNGAVLFEGCDDIKKVGRLWPHPLARASRCIELNFKEGRTFCHNKPSDGGDFVV